MADNSPRAYVELSPWSRQWMSGLPMDGCWKKWSCEPVVTVSQPRTWTW